MSCDTDHVTSLLSNEKKSKVKDKRNKEIKVIMAKAAYNTILANIVPILVSVRT